MSSNVRRRAIELLQAGRALEARQLLAVHIKANPQDALARRWYMETFHKETQKRSAPRSAAVDQAKRPTPLKIEPELPHAENQRAGLHPLLVMGIVVVAIFFCGFLSLSLFANKVLKDEVVASHESYQALLQNYNQISEDHQTLGQTHDQMKNDFDQVVFDLSSLNNEHQRLQNEYDSLIGEYNNLIGQYNALGQEYSSLTNEFDQFRSRSIAPPYIYVHGRSVELAFLGAENSFIRWQIPFETLETNIIRGNDSRNNGLPLLKLSFDEEKSVHVVDLRPFVDSRPFNTVIPQLYATTQQEQEFIWEVWQIIAQLTAYSSELEETPRFPLETLLAAGGDCEDTAVLFASMIKAAPVDWEVSLVYMDSNNPTNPQDVNHVIVRIDTGSKVYLVETTSKNVMEPFSNGVRGWFFPVEG